MKRLLLSLALSSSFSIGCGAEPAAEMRAEASGTANGLQYVERFIDKDQGGTLRLPDGAELHLPPGALQTSMVMRFARSLHDRPTPGKFELHDQGEDPTLDGDAYYEVTPSQKLLVPATLRIPYPLDPEWELPAVTTFSALNPLGRHGSQETRYAPVEDVVYDADADVVTVKVDHFSGIHLFTAGEPAYMVFDVPGRFLAPADILFTLGRGASSLALGPGPGWVPGHVGLYVGPEIVPPGATVDSGGKERKTLDGKPDVVEAIPDAVHYGSVDWFRRGFHDDHLYMGARRPPQDKALSAATRDRLAREALRSVGKPYYLLGDAGAVLGSFFDGSDLAKRIRDPFATDRGYSCVGLVDVLYLWGAGVSLVSPMDRVVFAATPKDMMETTQPVLNARMKKGETLVLPIYGVIRRPDYSAVTARIPYGRERSMTNDVTNGYDIELLDLPTGASVKTNDDGYVLTWTPSAPGTFTFKARMRADVKEKRNVVSGWFVSLVGLKSYVVERTREQPIEQSFTITVDP